MEIKKALEELNLYRKSEKRKSYLKQKITELKEREFSLGEKGENLGIQGGQVSSDDKLAALIDQIQKFTENLIDEETHGLSVQNDIEKKIYKLKEPYCSVLRGYYVEAKSLERIAVEYNYTFDGVKSIKYRGVQKYAKLPPLYDKSYYNEEIC